MEDEIPVGSGLDSVPVDTPRVVINRRYLLVITVATVAILLVAGSLLSAQGRGNNSSDTSASSTLGVKEGDPNEVAPVGSVLKRVTQPPAGAHVMISLPTGTPELAFDIEFEPFGIAPGGGLVIRVATVKPVGGGDDADKLTPRLQGANLVVRTSSNVNPLALRGGAHVGALKTIPEKDGYAFVLTKAEAR